jgi:peroxiredoxin
MRCVVVAVALTLGLTGCAPTSTPAAASSPATSSGSCPNRLEGTAAPDFSRPDLDGKRVALSAARGHVAVVKFIAKYCVPCRRTLPAIQRLHIEHPDVMIVGVSEDETEDDARAVVALYKLTFPIIHDRGSVLAGRYRVTDLPVTFVIDRTGNVSWVGGPEKTENELTSAILAR